MLEQGEIAGSQRGRDRIGGVSGHEGVEAAPASTCIVSARSFALTQRRYVGGVVPEAAAVGAVTSFASAAQADRQLGRIVTSAKRRMACP